MEVINIRKKIKIELEWESNQIRTVPEYGHSVNFRNNISYKKNCLINKIFIII